MSQPLALEFIDIAKCFGGVPVLVDVNLAVPAGQTLGLVGENGAGKSTLMNILGGNVRADSGAMRLEGRVYAPNHPTDAARARVAFIHQELNLFPNLTIAENFFITALPRLGCLPLVDRRRLRARAQALLSEVGLLHSPDTRVEDLSAGECQLVEIARALGFDARLIIFDEPTTSLGGRETAVLFALIRRLQARGIAMVYISHTLEHVLALCRRIAVLRDGRVVAHRLAAEFTASTLVAAMVGRTIDRLYPARQGVPAAGTVLEVRGVSQPFIARDIGFTLRRGEVLGISGLMGAGRSELARILFGLDPHVRGEIRLAGESLLGADVRRRIERGLAFVTEDRRHEGLCLDAAVADNIALVSLRDHARTPLRLIDRRSWRDAIANIRQAVRLTPTALDTQSVNTLSGGNQQKIVLAKWLLARPNVLILDEPTRGVDVRAKSEIYQLILDLADRGSGILLISSEIEELIGLCDRILVISQGEIRGEFARRDFDRERLLEAALPKEATA